MTNLWFKTPQFSRMSSVHEMKMIAWDAGGVKEACESYEWRNGCSLHRVARSRYYKHLWTCVFHLIWHFRKLFKWEVATGSYSLWLAISNAIPRLQWSLCKTGVGGTLWWKWNKGWKAFVLVCLCLESRSQKALEKQCLFRVSLRFQLFFFCLEP